MGFMDFFSSLVLCGSCSIPLLLLKADIKKVKNESGKMLGAFILVFCLLAVFIHLFITLIIGKMFKFKLDKLLLASNICIGEPTTAIAMSIAKGWNSLIVPTMIAGVWGYVLGNYAGIIVENILQVIL